MPDSGLQGITSVGREGFSVRGTVPAARVRWTRWWEPQSGGFVSRAPGGWTDVRTGPGGRIHDSRRMTTGAAAGTFRTAGRMP